MKRFTYTEVPLQGPTRDGHYRGESERCRVNWNPQVPAERPDAWIARIEKARQDIIDHRKAVMTEDMVRVQEALNGKSGDAQQQIAAAGTKVVAMLLRKNRDYGNSAWKVPVLAPGMTPRQAMQCRMSDKVARLSTLLSGQQAEVSESVEDTMADLAGYIILWLGVNE